MKTLRSRNSLWSLMVLFLAMAFLAGIRGTTAAAQAKRLDGKAVNPVTIGREGPQSGRFTANELNVEYKYVFSGSNMQLSGSVRFASPIAANYSVVRTFELGLILADAQGNVLHRQMLTTAYDNNVNDAIPFTHTVLVPPQATVMVFSYSGQAYGPGTSPTNFWLDPVTK